MIEKSSKMFVGSYFVLPCILLVVRYANADDVPDACKDKTYCSIKPDDYPQELIDGLLEGTKGTPTMVPVAVAESRDGDPDYKNDCPSEVTFEPLYKVRSPRGWHTVVQSPKVNFVQMVRLELCTNTETPCFSRFSIPSDLETFCRQSLSVWEFVVLNEDKTGTEKIQSTLPMCCSCYYKVKGL